MPLASTLFHVQVQVSKSLIVGQGLYTTEAIKPGQPIMEWGGKLVTRQEVKRVGRLNSIVQTNDGRYLVDPADGPAQPDEFINHSCDPNMGMASDVLLVARRKIMPCEELTIDYAMYRSIQWVFEPGWVMPCHCRSPHCRRGVRATDHLKPELQARYGDLFAPYLKRDQAARADTVVGFKVLPA